MPKPQVRDIHITASYDALVQLGTDLRLVVDDEKKALLVKQRLSDALLANLAPEQKPNLTWTMLEAGSSTNYSFSIVVVQEPRFAHPAGKPIEGLRSSDEICVEWKKLLTGLFKKDCKDQLTRHMLQAHLQFTNIASGTQPVLRSIEP